MMNMEKIVPHCVPKGLVSSCFSNGHPPLKPDYTCHEAPISPFVVSNAGLAERYLMVSTLQEHQRWWAISPLPLCPRYTLLHKICHLVIAFSAFGHPCKGHQDRLIHGAFNPLGWWKRDRAGMVGKVGGLFHTPTGANKQRKSTQIAVILVLELNFPTNSCWLWWFCLNASVKKKVWTFFYEEWYRSRTTNWKMTSPSNFQQLPTNFHPFVPTTSQHNSQKNPTKSGPHWHPHFGPAPSHPLRKCVDHQSPKKQKCRLLRRTCFFL